jgi:glycine/D-amino acid oxidase-like deaminating enzyme
MPSKKLNIEMAWSGVMAFGPVKEPLIGRISPQVFGGFRLGGMGVAIGSSIGEELATYVLNPEKAAQLGNKV